MFNFFICFKSLMTKHCDNVQNLEMSNHPVWSRNEIVEKGLFKINNNCFSPSMGQFKIKKYFTFGRTVPYIR